MTTKAYDEKNIEDYDRVTRALNEALDKISKNPKLPATQEEVCRIADVHRNTVANRGFPKKRLDKIKERRKEEAKALAKERTDKISELNLQIEKLSSELAFWYAQYRDANRDRHDFERQMEKIKDNADFYRSAYEKEKSKVRDLEAQNNLMKELLRDSK